MCQNTVYALRLGVLNGTYIGLSLKQSISQSCLWACEKAIKEITSRSNDSKILLEYEIQP